MENVKNLVDRWWKAFEAGHLDAVMDLTASDCELRMPGLAVRGGDAIRPVLQAYLTAFPGMKHTTVRTLGTDETIALELEIDMTHTGPFQTPQGAIAATGKKVLLHTCDVVTARNGRIVSWHAYFDSADLLGQLGLLPAPGAR